MSKRKRWFALFGAVATMLVAVAAVLVVHAVREHEEGEEEDTPLAFVREHPSRLRRLPVAVVREKLEHGKEAQREKVSGPAQAQGRRARIPA
jgi:hypothetical protein